MGNGAAGAVVIGALVVGLLACAGGTPTSTSSTAPVGVDCEEDRAVGSASSDQASPAPRWAEGTTVHFCTAQGGVLDGPHLELYPDGGVAVRGEWSEGERHADWVRWRADGAFSASVSHLDGRPHGLRREVADDGLVVEMAMEKGLAVDLRTLPAESPMPEWTDGVLGEGLRHRSP